MIVVTDDNVIKYIVDGKLHREDGPALICPDGTEYWYLNDTLHRENGPAVTESNGYMFWSLNGKQVKPEELPCDYDYLKLKYLS